MCAVRRKILRKAKNRHGNMAHIQRDTLNHPIKFQSVEQKKDGYELTKIGNARQVNFSNSYK